MSTENKLLLHTRKVISVSHTWLGSTSQSSAGPPFVTLSDISSVFFFHAFSVLIGQKGCTAQDREGSENSCLVVVLNMSLKATWQTSERRCYLQIAGKLGLLFLYNIKYLLLKITN